jgi:DNA replicative helicase MCM subunit Mcm2 (Cdc46/Mcm family)
MNQEETKKYHEEFIKIHDTLMNHLEFTVATPYTSEYPIQNLNQDPAFRFRINWLIGGELKPTGNPKLPYDNEYSLNPDIYELLIENPAEFKKLLEKVINSRFRGTYTDDEKKPTQKIIFTGLPTEKNLFTGQENADYIQISHIRPKDIDKGRYIKGIIKRKSNIKITTEEITRKCPNCEYTKTEEYTETEQINQNTNCPICKKQEGLTRRMKTISEKKLPIFTIELEEDPEETENQEIHRITIIMKETCARITTYEEIKIGDKIRIFGTPKLISKDKEKNMEIITFEALGIETINEKTKKNLVLTKENKEKIEEIKKNGSIIDYFSKKLYTNIQGNQQIKESIITQLVGNPQIKSGNKTTRGIIHQLIIGDAGSCKSTFLKLTQKYATKSRYCSGGGSSAVGLVAGVVKDEITGGWSAEAGALPLCHKSICLIDEIDKLNEEDIKKMHEALEQMQISIDKANIHITIPSETSVLGAGNPKYGNIDVNKEIYEQIDLPIPFINRFDLIWILIDKYDGENDKKIAEQIIKNLTNKNQEEEPVELFKQYITTAKNVKTTLNEELQTQIISWYDDIRKRMDGQGQQTMRLNARSIESLIRLTLAHARAELKETAEQEDFDWAKKTFIESIKYLAIDTITGTIDMQKLESGTSHSEREIIEIIMQTISQAPDKELTYQDIRRSIDEKIPDYTIDQLIEKMKTRGSIFSPRNGTYKLL